MPETVNVKAIRTKLKLTQEKFAHEYGFTLSAVQDWEQGRRTPERSARILLKVIEHDPKIVEKVLASQSIKLAQLEESTSACSKTV